MKKSQETSLIMPVTPAFIERRILLVRGQKVMLDSDLAELYQVPTKRLNEQVKRNLSRFPADFMFRLDLKEIGPLNRSQFATGSEESPIRNSSQIVTSSQRHRDPRFRPYVFTELGIAMLSSVINSDRAVQMNIFIMRAFVKLREMLATYADLAKKIEELEKGQKNQGKQISAVSIVLKRMIADQTNPKDVIGFQVG